MWRGSFEWFGVVDNAAHLVRVRLAAVHAPLDCEATVDRVLVRPLGNVPERQVLGNVQHRAVDTLGVLLGLLALDEAHLHRAPGVYRVAVLLDPAPRVDSLVDKKSLTSSSNRSKSDATT